MNSRELITAMLEGGTPDRLPFLPITMMFAADQTGAKYGKYATDYRVLADAQIVAADRFGFDHVSAITETREAPDCGAAVQYFEDQPYAMDESHARLADKKELLSLKMPDPWSAEHMHDRLKALSLLRERAGKEKFVEGWVEGPCGASADLRGINTLMLDFYDDPDFIRGLFDFVLELGIRFGKAQVEAGADLLGIGDPAASLVGPQIYEEFVWPYEKKLVDGLHAAGARVRLHICGNTKRILHLIGQLGCDMVDIDSAVPLAEARKKMGPDQVLIGGLDPVRALQNGTPESITAALEDCLRQAGPRYIVGAGCEVPRGTPAANMLAMRDFARSHKPQPVSA